MSRPGCQQTSAKPCNRNAEESFPVLSLKSQEQKPPNPLLIQDKNALQPRLHLCSPFGGCHDTPRRLFPSPSSLNASSPAAASAYWPTPGLQPPRRRHRHRRSRALGGRPTGSRPSTRTPFRHLPCRPRRLGRLAHRLRHHHRRHGIDRRLRDSLVRTLGDAGRAGPADRSPPSHARPRPPENRSTRWPVAATLADLRAARWRLAARGPGVRAPPLLAPPPEAAHLCCPPYSAHAQGLTTDASHTDAGRQ